MKLREEKLAELGLRIKEVEAPRPLEDIEETVAPEVHQEDGAGAMEKPLSSVETAAETSAPAKDTGSRRRRPPPPDDSVGGRGGKDGGGSGGKGPGSSGGSDPKNRSEGGKGKPPAAGGSGGSGGGSGPSKRPKRKRRLSIDSSGSLSFALVNAVSKISNSALVRRLDFSQMRSVIRQALPTHSRGIAGSGCGPSVSVPQRAFVTSASDSAFRRRR